MGRISNLWVLTGLMLLAVSFCDSHVSADVIPSENECRPYIEKAIHELKNNEATDTDDKEDDSAEGDGHDSIEAQPETGAEDDGDDSKEDGKSGESDGDDNKSEENATQENQTEEAASLEAAQDDGDSKEEQQDDVDSKEDGQEVKSLEDDKDSKEDQSNDSKVDDDNEKDSKADEDDEKDSKAEDDDSKEKADNDADSKESHDDDGADSKENAADDNDSKENTADDDNNSKETETGDDDDNDSRLENAESKEGDKDDDGDSKEGDKDDDGDSKEDVKGDSVGATADKDNDDGDSKENDDQDDSKEKAGDDGDDSKEGDKDGESVEETVRAKRSNPDEAQSDEKGDSAQNDDDDSKEKAADEDSGEKDGTEDSKENTDDDKDSKEETEDSKDADDDSKENATDDGDDDSKESDDDDETDEDDLTIEFQIPKNLRPREHVDDLLGLDAESSIKEMALRRTGDVVLKELKKVFDNAIKPLETLYKYRDLSNRHFGDPEIFSKPLILFMGPWSGGKSTILNYLTDNEYTPTSIRSGAEPSPAYFNILMHGDEPEVLDGTQLAADWTFSGLQKFGQGLMDRLRGQKLPNKLLERVNIVEIPGILEVRKQVSRYFPFNDACQWFIDRADIIFLVYDPSKLDVGPETEAILDQLKGREYQTRIVLNKADQVKPEELLRVQSALIWNISPLMSSAQPPVMYTVSLWSHPYETGSPIRLLQAQERALLSDLREAIDKRIENKIASARRFAVRIRNHAKMVDCYLTTYYNQKGLFSNKKQVADKIIEHPQNYNIYEGLSTLTNISRYDLPDPEVYLDFFKLNPLYDFKKLAETCTYFKGCPINKLDIAIAYDLPELVGKYKKLQEQNMIELRKEYDENCNQSEPEPPVKIIKSR